MILLDPEARPLVGHRGASGTFPENTILAFDRAREQGVDAIEFDVRGTADGVPVVIHDATLDRTTDGSGLVRAKPLAQIRELDAGSGERIPMLQEVLERYADLPMIIEIKEPEVSEAVLRLLLHYDAETRVLVGSFLQAALRPFERASVPRSASRRETIVSWVTSRVGLAYPGRAFDAFTVPPRHGAFTIVDRSFVRSARGAGRPVHMWTVDDPHTARRLRASGVAGLITNYPSRLRDL